jgi:hypothetical protein
VARDLRDGLLSAEQAAAIYRVAVNPVGEVDDAATARMREGAR